jgi:IS30 family transposase
LNYTHLTREERYQIHALCSQGIGVAAIAGHLGRHRSTIGRELSRNVSEAGYDPSKAHAQARERLSGPANVRTISSQTWQQAESYLRLGLSPEQVNARLRLEGRASPSKESLYLRVYADKAAGGNLIQYLRCQKVRRKRYGSGQERRGTLKNCVRIDKRPKVVEKRSRIADWEGDTVIGSGHQGVLVTLVERKSRYTLAAPLPRRTSTLVGQAMIDLLRPHKRRCKTITLDNGKEFADHAFVAKCLGAKVYFAHPYCSWERGLNENHNGLLRQYFPKAMSLAGVTQDQVDEAVYALNHRPRKCLGWRTPHEVFYGLEITPLRLEKLAAFISEQKQAPAHDSKALAAMKTEAMQSFRSDYAALRAGWLEAPSDRPTAMNAAQLAGYDRWVAHANNASFAAQAAYDELVPAFEALFAREGRQWPRFYDAVRQLAKQPETQRHQSLRALSPPKESPGA